MSDNRYGCKKCGTTWVGGTQPENHCPYCDREVPVSDYTPDTELARAGYSCGRLVTTNFEGSMTPFLCTETADAEFDRWFAPYEAAMAYWNNREAHDAEVRQRAYEEYADDHKAVFPNGCSDVPAIRADGQRDEREQAARRIADLHTEVLAEHEHGELEIGHACQSEAEHDALIRAEAVVLRKGDERK